MSELHGQIFVHTDSAGIERHFSVRFLEHHRQTHPAEWDLQTLPIDRALMRFFIQEHHVDVAWAKSFSRQRMDEPGIACAMPDDTLLTVDGSHRLVKRVLQGRRTMALWICQEAVWTESLVRYVDGNAIIPIGAPLP